MSKSKLIFLYDRYFFLELAKPFLLFLASFYFLYTILDYSTHMQHFMKTSSPSWLVIFKYYSFHFIKRMPILLSLSFLLALIKVLTNANVKNELLSLQSAGISRRKIFRPFFIFSLLISIALYLNFQFLTPQAMGYIDQFHASFLKKEKSKEQPHLNILYLDDRSKLIYQTYQTQDASFFDVFWVVSQDELWRIKKLSWQGETLIGHFAEHLVRDNQGAFTKSSSFEKKNFQEIGLERSRTHSKLIPLDHLSLKTLFASSFYAGNSEEKSPILTQLFLKIIHGMIPFLILLALSPFCIRFYRGFPHFLVYLGGLGSFVIFFTILDAFAILGKNEVFHPAFILLVPFILLTLSFGLNFYKKV